MDAMSQEAFNDLSAEAGSFSPDPLTPLGPGEYLEHLRRVKEAVRIPVMASLNGLTHGGWLGYAKRVTAMAQTFNLMRANDLPDWMRSQTWSEPPLIIRRPDGSVHPEYSAVKLSFGFPP